MAVLAPSYFLKAAIVVEFKAALIFIEVASLHLVFVILIQSMEGIDGNQRDYFVFIIEFASFKDYFSY